MVKKQKSISKHNQSISTKLSIKQTTSKPKPQKILSCKIGKKKLRSICLLKMEKTKSKNLQISVKRLRKVNECFPRIIAQKSQSFSQCPICLEIMVLPTLSNCGHAFCLECLEAASLKYNQCPVCRNYDSDAIVKPSPKLQKLIELNLKNSIFDSGQTNYFVRLAKAEAIESQRKIDKRLQINNYVDAYFEGNWKKGLLQKIISSFNQTEIYQIRLLDENKVLNLPSDSRKIAKYGYFTHLNSQLEQNMKAQPEIVNQSNINEISSQNEHHELIQIDSNYSVEIIDPPCNKPNYLVLFPNQESYQRYFDPISRYLYENHQ